MTKEIPIKIYQVGEYYEDIYAIKCNDVKDIDEARNIILKYYPVWKDDFSDEEYLEKFGKPKVVILKEETCYIRYTGRWVEYGYECPEREWVNTWNKTDKVGRGAIECYVFYVEDSFRETYNYWIERKKEVE